MDSKKAVLQLIAAFKSHPCLWRVKSPEYMNRPRKRQAFDAIADEMRAFDDDVTADDVRKKFNSLRAGYRREKKKVESFGRSGAGTEESEAYEPSLFYYGEMDFLKDQEDPSDSMSNIQLENDVSIISFISIMQLTGLLDSIIICLIANSMPDKNDADFMSNAGTNNYVDFTK